MISFKQLRKLSLLLIALPALLVTAADPGWNAVLPPGRGQTQKAAQDSVPGEIIVRLRDARDAGFTGTKAAAAALRLPGPAASLQQLHTRFRLKQAQRVLGDMGGPASQSISAGLQARLRKREARGPVDGERVASAARDRLERSFVLTFDSAVDLESLIAAYRNDPAVEAVAKHAQYHALFTPNDPYYASSGSWGQPDRDLWGLAKMQADQAWDKSTGEDIIVAVVDSGVDYNHPDIQANIWRDPITNQPGYNTVTNTPDPMDDNGHGTHVAGIIAAAGNNNAGIIGLAYRSRIMPVKSLTALGSGSESMLSKGVLYAADHGADVINCSWGGPGDSFIIRDAIEYAHAKGAVIVAAAGNESDNLDNSPSYPACLDKVITVGASSTADHRASFSNYGYKIDVVAPGGNDSPVTYPPSTDYANILSLRASQSTHDLALNVGTNLLRLAGTSMATPYVSGLAALILSEHPEYSNELVRQAIRLSADDLETPGWDPDTGYGRINAARALDVQPTVVARLSHPKIGAFVSRPTDVVGSALGSGFKEYLVEVGAGVSPAAWTLVHRGITPVDTGRLGVLDAAALPMGTYTLRLRVIALDGQEAMDQIRIFRDNGIGADLRLRWLSPEPGASAILGSNVRFEVIVESTADGSYPNMSRVTFYDGYRRLGTVTTSVNQRFQFFWKPETPGAHEIRAEGVYAQRSFWTEPNTVTVKRNIELTVEPPSNGVYQAGDPITLAALLNLPSLTQGGQLKIFANDIEIFSDPKTYPFGGSWIVPYSWTDVAPGTYALKASLVVDGTTQESETVTLRVVNNPAYLPLLRGFLSASDRIPLNGEIRVDAVNATRLDWVFTPQDGSASGSAPGLRAAAAPGSVHSITSVPRISLAALGLTPGTYRVDVTAFSQFNDASATLTGTFQLTAGGLQGARVFPSPWQSNLHTGHPVTFDGLPVNSTVKIFTLSGHWVCTLPAPNGSAPWNLTNANGDAVASGLYLYLVSSPDDGNARGKIAIIR